MSPHRVSAITVAALAVTFAGGPTHAQPPAPPGDDPYAGIWSGEEPTGAAPTDPLWFRVAEEEARRAVVVARAGGLSVTVGELEDRLARVPLEPSRSLDDLELRRELARELLRARLLARVAERRGLGEHPDVRFAERRALVDALVERDFAAARFAVAPEPVAAVPALRRPLVVFATTRAGAARLRSSVRDGDLDAWDGIARDTPAPPGAPATGELGWVAREPREGEDAIDPALREALFSLERYGEASAPVRVGELFGVVVLTGERGPVAASEVGPVIDRAWTRRAEELDALVASLEREHLRDVRPALLYEVAFELAAPDASAPAPAVRSENHEVEITTVEPREGR